MGLNEVTPAEWDAVSYPEHYNTGSVECIEAIKASMSSEGFKGYLKGNIEKYLWRYEQTKLIKEITNESN